MKQILALALLLLVAACAGTTEQGTAPIEVSPPGKQTPPTPKVEPPPTAPDVEDSTPSDTDLQEFEIEARSDGFFPGEIRVDEGRVRLVILSSDRNLRMTIPEYGVDERLLFGEEIIVEFDANNRGEYGMYCIENCTNGVEGLIIVG